MKVKERKGRKEGERKQGRKEEKKEGREKRKEQKRKHNHLYNISGISLICKPWPWLQYNNAIMLLPCLGSCEQFSETSNTSGLVGNAFKKKTTEHCKKRWILTYRSTYANKCTGKQFTSIQHLRNSHMVHDTGVGTMQVFKRPGSCKVHMSKNTMWTCAEWCLDVQEEVCFPLY